jgi:hypothetical protein
MGGVRHEERTRTVRVSTRGAESRTATRLPALVYVIAAGIFLMGTTEFMIAGLLRRPPLTWV